MVALKLKWHRSSIAAVLLFACVVLLGIGNLVSVSLPQILPTEGVSVAKNVTLKTNASINDESSTSHPIDSSSSSSDSLTVAAQGSLAYENIAMDGTSMNHSATFAASSLVPDPPRQQQQRSPPGDAECIRNNISTIYLHIGPHKTGTTTIQDFCACRHSDFLRQHNTYYLGKVNERDFKDIPNCHKKNAPRDFVRPMVQYNSNHAMKTLRSELEQHVALGHNVILSDEGFYSVNQLIEKLFATMDKNLQYNIVPIVVYRRYYDMVLSRYHFAFRPKSYETGWNSWKSPKDILTFRAFWHLPKNQQHAGIVYHNAVLRALQRARQASNSTNTICPLVLNLHQEGTDLMTQFVNQVVVAAAGTGETTTNNSDTPRNKPANMELVSNKGAKTSLKVDSEILALKLKAEGRLHEKFKRRKVVTKLFSKMQALYDNGDENATTSPPPPLDCLTAHEHEKLYTTTLESERTLLVAHQQQPPGWQEALRNKFDAAIAKDSFCNIRLDELLREEAWQPLLSCLQEGGNWCGKEN